MAEVPKVGLTVVRTMLGQDNVKQRFEQLLGSKAPAFISSVLQIMQNDTYLSNCLPETVLNAAATAAVLDLPINQDLGFAWIVPYGNKAQFQMGWKGFVQLAVRTGLYQIINVIDIHKSQFVSFDPITEALIIDRDKEECGNIIGYAGHFELKTGFKKTVYWSRIKITVHAKKYSKTYAKKNNKGQLIKSPWNDPFMFDAMARKTVLKAMISKWGIMSIEMQKAHLSDQAVINDEGQPNYIDGMPVDVDGKKEAMKKNTAPNPDPMP